MNENELVKADSNPQSLIQMAIQSNLPIEHLERLMALKERYDANEAKKEFLTAMTLFQSSCPALEKTKVVDFTSRGTNLRTYYKYAPLGEISATIKTALKEAGLSYRWEMNDETEKIICTCIISHANGHSEKSTMSALKDTSGNKNEIQSRGSTITYLQRYTLIAALGISTADEDNDGTTAPANQQPAAPASPAPSENRNQDSSKPALLWLNKLEHDGTTQTNAWKKAITYIKGGGKIESIKKKYRINKVNEQELVTLSNAPNVQT